MSDKDTIYRQDAIDAVCSACGYDCDEREFVYNAPQGEQVIMCPEHYALSTLPSAQQCMTATSNTMVSDTVKIPVMDGTTERLLSAESRKKGKWNTYYHSDIEFSHSCNQCGYSAPYQMIGGEVFQKKWNFCPNCGADMRENT